MIRRYATEFRLLLAMTDALIAVAAFLLASYWRFGADWTSLWRLYLPDPSGFLVAYALGWVTVLAVNGLYRPRARWTFRSEALDVLRATVVMALVTLAVLFFFKLPDVSRLFLLFLFPITAALDARLAGHPALRLRAPPAARAQPALRPRPRRRAARPGLRRQAGGPSGARPPGRRLPRRRRRRSPPRSAGPTSARSSASRAILHEQVIDEVVICLPFTPVAAHRRHRPALRAGGQDRPHPDRRPRPGDRRRQGRGARRDARLLARLRTGPRAGPGDQAAPRRRRRRRSPSSLLSPLLVGIAIAIVARRRRGRSSSARSASASTAGPSRWSSSGRWSPTPRRAATSWTTATRSRARLQGHRRPARHPRRALPAAHEPRRAAPALERAQRRDEPRRARGRRCRARSSTTTSGTAAGSR